MHTAGRVGLLNSIAFDFAEASAARDVNTVNRSRQYRRIDHLAAVKTHEIPQAVWLRGKMELNSTIGTRNRARGRRRRSRECRYGSDQSRRSRCLREKLSTILRLRF